MKAYILFIFSLFTIAGYSQNTINNYKYVLVPARFEFFSEDDKYGLNTTTKELLEQKGFTAFVGNEQLPSAVAANKCNALQVEVVQRKGLFSTNLTLLLKDCQGNIIFKSKEGKSREKEYQLAYDLSLRDAFSSLKDLPYQYDGTVFTQTQQGATTPVTSPSTSPPGSSTPPPPPVSSAGAEITGALYAQSIPNGYQVIDTTPKKVLTLLKTSVQDYFIAETGASNGIVFKKNGEWYFEYYKDNQLVSQKLEIKF
jgi:hypothetical protein